MNSDAPDPTVDSELLQELFLAASELDEAERAAFLDSRCENRKELRQAIDDLLRASRQADSASMWNRPALYLEAWESAGDRGLPFQRLGPYRMISCLGVGGMGAVYLAERDDEAFQKKVAIKLVPRAFLDEDASRRFRQERQILAQLEHPNIARILDAGRTPDGLPYLVMEYVDGVPIDRYAAERNLSVHERLALLRTVCDAVALAHRNHVIHRDLKPRNILVTNEGVPKLLDFGIAKLLSESSGETPTATSTVRMTPGYASPEQGAGKPVNPASDVYSLGVLMYELITGSRPYGPGETEAAWASGREPQSPAARLRTGAAIPIGAPPDAMRAVSRDLSKVVLKALQVEPEQRYQSVAELSEDVGRVIAGMPVRARRRTLVYRAVRLVARRRRQWTVAAAAVAVVAFLFVGVLRRSPPPPPRIGRAAIVAYRAWPVPKYVSDGQRVFFVQRNGFRWTLAQVPVEGGPPGEIPSPFKVPTIFDISPDKTRLLLGADANQDDQTVWTMPVAGGKPERLGQLIAHDASWSPDGRRIVFVRGAKVFVAATDGSASREIAGLPGDYLEGPRWSPDRQEIRVTLFHRKENRSEIWRLGADGAKPRVWLPGWQSNRSCCGDWMDSGRYFVFDSRVKNENNIWAAPEKPGLFRSAPEPYQLTAGPTGLLWPIVERRGRRILATGAGYLTELHRYDASKGALVPYLGGISARMCNFSPDGKQVSYITFPGRKLYRSRPDGSGVVLLTDSVRALSHQWAPEGDRIFMMATAPGSPSRIYVVPVAGGRSEEIVPGTGTQADPTLSPDGRTIAFSRLGVKSDLPADQGIFLYNLATRKLSAIEDSKGKVAPRWSPDGRHIAAYDNGTDSMMLWDIRSQTWKSLVRGPGPFFYHTWTRDSRYLYYGCAHDDLDAICRVRVSDGFREIALDTYRFHREDTSHSEFAGLTPDGQILIAQFTHEFDLSALELELPQ